MSLEWQTVWGQFAQPKTLLAEVSAPENKELAKPRGRGRPARLAHSGKEKERRHFREDLFIADAVYRTVFEGASYRGEAMEAGQAEAAKFGRTLSPDGVEAIIKRLIKNPEALYSQTPGEARRSLLQLAGQFIPNASCKNGERILFYRKPEPFTPDGDEIRPADFVRLRRCRD